MDSVYTANNKKSNIGQNHMTFIEYPQNDRLNMTSGNWQFDPD